MSSRRYARTARVNELLREILGEAVERIDDDRLGLVTISGVEVDTGLEHAVVYYSSLEGDDADEEVQAALEHHRRDLQAQIATQARLRQTPRLAFRPDHGIRDGARDRGDPAPDARLGPAPRRVHGHRWRPAGPVRRAVSRRGRAAGPHGLCVIDKQAGWTSHDVVACLRGVLGTRRVGHAGTLDPDATGVLLVGAGQVTRLLRFLSALEKSYVGEVVFGAETDTLDAAGTVTSTHDMTGLRPGQVAAAASGFVGEILQVPPMVSAVRVGGRRLHELAREGKEVDRPARPVRVHDLALAPTADPLVYSLSVRCSSGFYVRSLAADLGTALGGGAHLRALRRTRIGSFGLGEAVPFTRATGADEIPVLAPTEALRDMPAVRVDASVAESVGHGSVLARDRLGVEGDGPWAVLGPDDTLLAVYEPVERPAASAKPAVVLASG